VDTGRNVRGGRVGFGKGNRRGLRSKEGREKQRESVGLLRDRKPEPVEVRSRAIGGTTA
jgi:hypothetical protein